MPYYVCIRQRKPENLQDLCFITVASNFEKVISKYSSEIGIGFLRRKPHLLLRAFRKVDGYKIKLEHALFCLGPYLKELDLLWFDLDDIPSVINKLRTVVNNLTALSGPEMRGLSPDTLWQLIHSLPVTIKCLSLNHTCCTDNMVEIITNLCPQLQELNLRYCNKITDHGVKTLCRKDEQGTVLPNLVIEKLDLDHTRVTKKGIVFALNNFPNLMKIRYRRLDKVIHDMYKEITSQRELSHIKAYNLKSVSELRTDCACSDGLMAFSVLCPLLTELNVTFDTQVQFDTFIEFTSLQDVLFVFNGRHCNFLTFLKIRGKNLKALSIKDHSGSPLPSEAITKYCSRLKFLQLEFVQFAKVESLADSSRQDTLPNLMEIVLQLANHDNLEESVMYLLCRSPNLEKFSFWNVSVIRSSSFANSLVHCLSTSKLKKLLMHNVKVIGVEFLNAFHNFKVDMY